MIADFYQVQVGWGDEVSTFEIKIECPETLKGCSSEKKKVKDILRLLYKLNYIQVVTLFVNQHTLFF